LLGIQFAKRLLRQELQENIYVIASDGSDVQLLVLNGSFPHWSPDGGQIAFTRREKNTDIYLVDADGSNERVLVSGSEDDYYPRWSPAGTRLTFVSGDFGAEGIHVIDANGSNLRNLTNREGQHSVPDWSPDGRRIVFVSRLEDSIWNDIWVVEVDTTNLYPLTDGGQWENPKWSPACTYE
jgi:TolB protein